MLIIKKICLSFNKIKLIRTKNKINESVSFKKSSSAGTYKSMLNNLPVPLGSFSYSKRMMPKVTNKITEGKI